MKDKLIAIALVFGGGGAVATVMLVAGAPLNVAASFGFVTAFLLSFPAIHGLEASQHSDKE